MLLPETVHDSAPPPPLKATSANRLRSLRVGNGNSLLLVLAVLVAAVCVYLLLFEFKNSSSTWQSFQSVLWNLCGWPCGGGTSPWTTSGNNIYNSNMGNVGIGTASPSGKLGVLASGAGWAGYLSGSTYGIYAQSGAGQAVQGQSSGSYGGYFTGYGGVYAANSSGYYAFLGYPGTNWGVYSNGNVYASDYYIAAAGRWASQMGTPPVQFGPEYFSYGSVQAVWSRACKLTGVHILAV